MTVLETVTQAVRDSLGSIDKPVEPTSKLMDLGLDSLNMVEVVTSLEDTYNIKVPNSDVGRLVGSTVADVVEYVNEKVGLTHGGNTSTVNATE